MKELIPAVDKDLIISELTKEKFVRKTNNGDNELYILDCHNAPNTLKEIGRLREYTFREAGGGTGLDCDLDAYDSSETPYQQLIVWDPTEKEILGGYRFFHFKGIDYSPADEDYKYLATGKLFAFSEEFKKDYIPRVLELGRSFVQPKYQNTARLRRKGMFALDNLWDGLGAIVVDNPELEYFFGKVTMYSDYNPEARNLLLYFNHKRFGDPKGLVTPREPLDTGIDKEAMAEIFTGTNYAEDYKILSARIRALGETIPPLINSYMNVSSSMKFFGTVINGPFGGVEESALMVTCSDMYPKKVERHIDSYLEEKKRISLG